tara:strand:+ start:43767 stop:44321 length:555 start_codon:yes stop_codon:yes gene_type:complete
MLKVIESHNSVRFKDLTNAGLKGKICTTITIYFNDKNTLLNILGERNLFLKDITTLRHAQVLGEICKELGMEVYESTEKGVRVFSETSKAYKPLKEVPSDMRLHHVVKALVNGQYKDLKCKGRYTDDYHYDNATNFGKNKKMDALKLAQDLVESPSGWWVSLEGNKVGVNCHSFDYNEFELVLD